MMNIHKFFPIMRWETSVLKCWPTFPCSCSQIGEPHTILVYTCWMFQVGVFLFFENCSTSSVSLFAAVPTFVAGIKFQMKIKEVTSFNI